MACTLFKHTLTYMVSYFYVFKKISVGIRDGEQGRIKARDSQSHPEMNVLEQLARSFSSKLPAWCLASHRTDVDSCHRLLSKLECFVTYLAYPGVARKSTLTNRRITLRLKVGGNVVSEMVGGDGFSKT